MELDIIKSQTTWNEASGSINSNFSKVRQAIIALQEAEGGGGSGSGEEGIDEAQLEAYLTLHKYVTQSWVGNAFSDYDSAIKQWVNDQGFITSVGGGDIDLSDYAKQADLEALTKRFDAVFDGREDQDDHINKWHELVEFLDGVSEDENLATTLLGHDERIQYFEDMFEWVLDESGNRTAIRAKSHFFSTGQVAAGGIGKESGGGGGGGISLLFDSTKTWADYTSDMADYALAAYHGKALNDRLVKVEGKATDVSFTQTLLTGKPIGTIMVDGVSQTMYAPATYSADDIVPTQERNFVSLQDIEYWNTAYLPKTGGTFKGSLVPDRDGAYHLGSSSYRMGAVFALQGVFYGGLSINHESVATQTWADGRYVRTSGQGKITSPEINVLYLNSTSSYSTSAMVLQVNDTNKAYFGVNDTNGAFIYNYAANSYIGVKPDGTPHYNGAYTLLHSGNYSNYVLPLSGGTLSKDGSDILVIDRQNSTSPTTITYKKDNGLLGRMGFDAITKEPVAQVSGTYKTLLHSGNYSSYALPLSGGTLQGDSADLLVINRLSSTSSAYITFKGNGDLRGRIGFDANNNPIIQDLNYGSGNHTLLHSGNYATEIGDYYLKSTGGTLTGMLTLSKDGSDILVIDRQNSTSPTTITYKKDNGLLGRMGFDAITKEPVAQVSGTYQNLIHSGNIGSQSVASATKLATARTFWGQSFDGTANIDGEMRFRYAQAALYARLNDKATDAIFLQVNPENNLLLGQQIAKNGGSVSYYGKTMRFCYGTGATSAYTAMFINDSGNVGIGTTNPQYKLDVNGDIRTNASLRIGNAILSWDSANNALKIEGNVYATGQMASGGVGTAN